MSKIIIYIIKYITSKIWEIVEKIKMDVDIDYFWFLIMKTNFTIYFAKIEVFINFETKSCLSESVFTSLTF